MKAADTRATPVSYTHLDVYKRQMFTFEKGKNVKQLKMQDKQNY